MFLEKLLSYSFVHPMLLGTKQTYFIQVLSSKQVEHKAWLTLHGFAFSGNSLGCERDPHVMHVG